MNKHRDCTVSATFGTIFKESFWCDIFYNEQTFTNYQVKIL